MNSTVNADVIVYRQGHLTVSSVHEGCINIECWMISPASSLNVRRNSPLNYQDDEVIANVELEFSISEAKSLVRILQAEIKGRSSSHVRTTGLSP